MEHELIADKRWRLTHLYKIVTKQGDWVTFSPNEIQEQILFDPAPRQAILKARQFGISTAGILDYLDDTIFNENITTVILAHEQDSIQKLFRIARRAYDKLPEEFKPRLDRGGGSKYEMYFPDINSRIYCDLESRGDTIQRLHVSEAAFMKDSSKLKSTLQAVPHVGGKVRKETTANGMGNHYYDFWIDPDQPDKKFFFPWYAFENYKIEGKDEIKPTDEEEELKEKAKKLFDIKITDDQIRFRRLKKAELKTSLSDITRVTFEQEYPEDDVTCFLSSGDAVMDLFEIKKMLDSAPAPLTDSGWMKTYEVPSKFCRYVIAGDVAEGVQGDSSVGIVLNVTNKTIAAKIKSNKWKPEVFADELKKLADMFSWADKPKPLLAVERNNHGHATILWLDSHHGYENMYVHDDEGLGWKTDKITRPMMVDTLIYAIENKYIPVVDREVLSECLTLVNVDGKIEAASGKHDDCFIALAIAYQLLLKEGVSAIYDDIENKIRL